MALPFPMIEEGIGDIMLAGEPLWEIKEMEIS